MPLNYADDEVHFIPLSNLYYALGVLDAPPKPYSDKTMITMGYYIDRAAEQMERLGLRVSAANARDLVLMLEGKHPSTNIPTQMATLRGSLQVELDQTLFLHVRYEEARFYREPLEDVSEDAQNNFASTLEDLREAARCFALNRSAASVFHSMRVWEVGLISLGKSLGVPSAGNQNWHSLLVEIERAINSIDGNAHGPDWRAERHWYADAAVQFRYVKDAWRNEVMHVHQSYNQQHARAILVATRAFISHIAERLKE